MTDNEIIKALDCCNIGRCDGCPYQDVADCMEQNGKDLLDLINRQKAEIDSLNNEIDKLLKQIPTVDAVEVVRCKDCKYSKITHGSIAGEKIRVCMYPCIPCGVKDDHYCGYGERKGDNND